ncbi:hypothetical protein [Leptodesmis sp.]|uniref:hypothetical protein n=1 Tax=Leptodesmis sp. TaxID=3100501 RepID=UPI0040534EEC
MTYSRVIFWAWSIAALTSSIRGFPHSLTQIRFSKMSILAIASVENFLTGFPAPDSCLGYLTPDEYERQTLKFDAAEAIATF